MNGYARHNLILKVFSGPHVGAEVILRNGEHTIGSSDDCDVILHDRLIAPRHARLLISEGRVQCDRLDDAVLMIDGKPQESAVLAPFQYFTLGNTHLAIGPADQPWPAMSFPDFKLRQMGPSLETPPVESKPVAGQKVRTSRSSRRKYYWAMMAAAILMMIAAVGFPVWPSRAPISDAQTLNAAHLQHRLAETIAECAPGSIVDIQFENGRCCVRGYVDNAEQQRRLQRRLPDICPNVRLRLWNSDQLVRAAAEVLAAGGLALNAAKGAPGEVVIRGAVSNGKCWDDVQRLLRRDVPTIRRLTSFVQVAGVSGPSLPTTVAADNPAAMGPTENGAVRETIASEETMTRDVSAINIGTYAWIVRRDGSHVFPGGAFEGGIVKAIRPEGIVLSQANGDRTVVLEGGK